MKINVINQNFYGSYKVKPYDMSFQGKIQCRDFINRKVFTKGNLHASAILFMLASLGCYLNDIKECVYLMGASNVCAITALFMKEKTKNLKKLQENIEFREAKSLKEAQLYAENELGIKNYEINDLAYANWVNEGLTNISNKFKGNVYFPKTVKFASSEDAIAYYNAHEDSICICPENIEEDIKYLEKILKRYRYKYLTKYNLGNGYEEFCALLKRAYDNYYSLSLFEKYALLDSYKNSQEIIFQLERKGLDKTYNGKVNKYGNVYPNKFDTIYHEIGHCFKEKTTSTLNFVTNKYKFKSKIKDLKLPENSKKDIDEFVATIFSGIIQGEIYSEEIMNIFNKIIGFKIPN